jgi:hypothetical protein
MAALSKIETMRQHMRQHGPTSAAVLAELIGETSSTAVCLLAYDLRRGVLTSTPGEAGRRIYAIADGTAHVGQRYKKSGEIENGAVAVDRRKTAIEIFLSKAKG